MHELLEGSLGRPVETWGKREQTRGTGCMTGFVPEGKAVLTLNTVNRGAQRFRFDEGQCPSLASQSNKGSNASRAHSHILLAATAAKSLQSCPTLCDPIDGSPPGSPVPGILQARTLQWVATSFSNA